MRDTNTLGISDSDLGTIFFSNKIRTWLACNSAKTLNDFPWRSGQSTLSKMLFSSENDR